jgi:hypothetical protein
VKTSNPTSGRTHSLFLSLVAISFVVYFTWLIVVRQYIFVDGRGYPLSGCSMCGRSCDHVYSYPPLCLPCAKKHDWYFMEDPIESEAARKRAEQESGQPVP